MKILAIHPGALGDVIIFGHLLRRIAGEITLAAGGEKARLLKQTGIVQWAIDFDALPMHEIFTDAPPDKCRLPQTLGRAERLISCFPSDNHKAQLRLAAMCGAADSAFLPVRPDENYDGHLLELWCDMLDGLEPAPVETTWAINEQWRDDDKNQMSRLGLAAAQNYFIIHPGAGAEEKRWPLDNFLQLGQILREMAGRPEVIFIIGPVELDRWKKGRISDIKQNFPLLQSPSPAAMAGILAGASGYIGNDSGVSHLAAAVAAPTVAMFGPSNPKHFAPIGRNVKIIRAYPIENITVEEVFAALDAADN